MFHLNSDLSSNKISILLLNKTYARALYVPNGQKYRCILKLFKEKSWKIKELN